MKFSSKKIRQDFIDFFLDKEHKFVRSSPVFSLDDPTLLFVNAGIYVMEPEILSMIPDKEFFDMPLLFEQLLQQKQNTSAFPIREYWRDIGQKEDLIQANGEFHHELTTKLL